MIIKYINEEKTNFDLEDIDINNFNSLSRIYSFTTENIAGYYELLDFNNKNILTVAASGDHIINAFFKAANRVTGFDINYLALIYTELKLVALQTLEYEEFLSFFMINEKDDINKNKNALNFSIYKNRIREYLSKNTADKWDLIYSKFNNNGYELRNSYIFNNKYDNNKLKIDCNLYLKDKNTYEFTKKIISNKEIVLINDNYRNINKLDLTIDIYHDIILSNISDYIEKLYLNSENYLEEYIKDIISIFKNENNKIVCAYIYNIQNKEYRSYIDNPTIREDVFNKLKIKPIVKTFESVIDNCEDEIIII